MDNCMAERADSFFFLQGTRARVAALETANAICHCECRGTVVPIVVHGKSPKAVKLRLMSVCRFYGYLKLLLAPVVRIYAHLT